MVNQDKSINEYLLYNYLFFFFFKDILMTDKAARGVATSFALRWRNIRLISFQGIRLGFRFYPCLEIWASRIQWAMSWQSHTTHPRFILCKAWAEFTEKTLQSWFSRICLATNSSKKQPAEPGPQHLILWIYVDEKYISLESKNLKISLAINWSILTSPYRKSTFPLNIQSPPDTLDYG